IGAIQAIQDTGLDIDFIGGSSMGAIIGASLALGSSIEDVAQGIQNAFVKSNPLSDVTLPLISLVKGRKVERLLADYFGGIEIPDLWYPFYCVSSNLSDGTLKVHREGLVREVLRASVALPGVLPPKIIGNDVLVDGAVLDNLPVDVMRGIHRGPVIAIDVTRDRALKPEMLAIEHKTSFLERLTHPPIISILMRAGTVSSDAEMERQAQDADLLIEPPLGDIDIPDWRAFDEAVTIGYEHTVKLLSENPGALQRLRRVQPV
ncbi:MAG: cyclic nucleotide-binding protein, partial [Alphaproteobacteria bacterium]